MKTINFYKNNRFLGFIASGNILLVSAYKYYHTGKWNIVTCSVAILFLISAIFYPRAIGLLKTVIEWAVMKLTDAVSIVVLFILYFFILTPINLMRKAVGKDDMKLKNTRQQLSYWQPVNNRNSKDLRQQF